MLVKSGRWGGRGGAKTPPISYSTKSYDSFVRITWSGEDQVSSAEYSNNRDAFSREKKILGVFTPRFERVFFFRLFSFWLACKQPGKSNTKRSTFSVFLPSVLLLYPLPAQWLHLTRVGLQRVRVAPPQIRYKCSIIREQRSEYGGEVAARLFHSQSFVRNFPGPKSVLQARQSRRGVSSTTVGQAAQLSSGRKVGFPFGRATAPSLAHLGRGGSFEPWSRDNTRIYCKSALSCPRLLHLRRKKRGEKKYRRTESCSSRRGCSAAEDTSICD